MPRIERPRACRRGLAAAVCAGALLAGCAVPPAIQEPGGAQQAQALSRVGRFALHIKEADDRENAVQGSFAWRDDGRELLLDLASPMGTVLARVQVTPEVSILKESNGQVTTAATPDELLGKVLGSAIPVAGLRDWMRGQLAARPPAQVAERDEQGRALAFEQDGWRVNTQRFDALGPTRLQMARRHEGQDVDLRLVINP